MLKTGNFLRSNQFLPGVLAICLSFWGYLFFASQMDISQDAVGYQKLGMMLQKEGWREYFVSGPNREPLYPFIISLSMRIADSLQIDYRYIQKLFQIAILLLSQILIFKIFKTLNIDKKITALTLLYFGLSPAIVNTGFSLYSEVATYPWILLIIIFSINIYKSAKQSSVFSLLIPGTILGFLFTGLTFVKGIYQFIIFLYTATLLLIALFSYFNKELKLFKQIIVILLAMNIVFQLLLIPYKKLNQQYNGQYTLTNRGSFALVGSVARRMEPMSLNRILTAIAYIPGEGACYQFFTKKDCDFWGIFSLDTYAAQTLGKISKDTPPDQVDKKAIQLMLTEISKKPLQFFLLQGQDALKMFFWESTRIGFVSYPPTLKALYNSGLIRNGIRLITSLLTLWAYFYLLMMLMKNLKGLWKGATNQTNEDHLLTVGVFFILLIITCHVGMYSIFDTIPRFALPLAPLYVATIGIAFNQIHKNRLQQNTKASDHK